MHQITIRTSKRTTSNDQGILIYRVYRLSMETFSGGLQQLKQLLVDGSSQRRKNVLNSLSLARLLMYWSPTLLLIVALDLAALLHAYRSHYFDACSPRFLKNHRLICGHQRSDDQDSPGVLEELLSRVEEDWCSDFWGGPRHAPLGES